MTNTVFERLKGQLDQMGVAYEVLEHPPVFTSEEAAKIRGTPLSSGAKALICMADEQFYLFVLPADRRLASKAIKKEQRWKSLRFATPEEVLELTQLRPGSIPPFGSLFSMPTWCDPRLAENPRINFNAGDHAISMSMTYDDYLAAESPRIVSLAECSDNPKN